MLSSRRFRYFIICHNLCVVLFLARYSIRHFTLIASLTSQNQHQKEKISVHTSLAAMQIFFYTLCRLVFLGGRFWAGKLESAVIAVELIDNIRWGKRIGRIEKGCAKTAGGLLSSHLILLVRYFTARSFISLYSVLTEGLAQAMLEVNLSQTRAPFCVESKSVPCKDLWMSAKIFRCSPMDGFRPQGFSLIPSLPCFQGKAGDTRG